MVQQAETKSRVKREQARQAVNLAMESRWEEAVSVNREILKSSPDDVEALNRLGKALSEMGKYSKARRAFQRGLEISPSNSIARKNLDRIGLLREDSPQRPSRQGVPPHFFIEETGKTRVTSLMDTAPKELLAKMTAGEPVFLEPREHKLVGKNSLGERLGMIEPKLGLRLLRLMRGGNKYEAAITSLDEQGIRVIIKEIYQHPSQIGKLSFPSKGHEGIRAFASEGVVSYGIDEDEEPRPEADDWGDEREPGLEDAGEYKRLSSRTREHAGAEEEEEL